MIQKQEHNICKIIFKWIFIVLTYVNMDMKKT